MTLDADILLSLAEVCVSVTGFVGIVVVLGSRSAGKWTSLDDARFWSLMLNCLSPVALSLLPILFGTTSYKPIGLIVGGTWAVLLIKQAASAIRIPKASTKLAVYIIISSTIVYLLFVMSALDLINVSVQQFYLFMILWNLKIAFIFFVRLLRSERAVI